MLQYILEVTLCWTLFYAIFFALLRKVTFYRVNRWYLLGALVAGILIPLLSFIDLDLHQEQVAQAAPLVYVVKEAPAYIANTVIEQIIDWQYIIQSTLLGLYLIGVTFFLIRFLKGLTTIYRLYNNGSKTHHNHHTVVNTSQPHLPFSFLNNIFISQKLPLKGDIEDILKHELAHVKGQHSVDVLLLELINIVFWFHPLVYLYKTAIRQTHEYLADAVVLQSTSRKIYGNILLKQSLSGLEVALAHHFFHSHIKKRINMMYQKKSGQSAWLKYALALPILLLLFVVFSGYQSHEVYTTDDLSYDWNAGCGGTFMVRQAHIYKDINEAAKHPNPIGGYFMTDSLVKTINNYNPERTILIVVDGKIIMKGLDQFISPDLDIIMDELTIINTEAAIEKYGDLGKHGVLELNRIKQTADIHNDPLNLRQELEPNEEIGKNDMTLITTGNFKESAKEDKVLEQYDSFPSVKNFNKPKTDSNFLDSALIIINGDIKGIGYDWQIESNTPNKISKLEFLRNKEDAIEQYGQIAKHGAIELTTESEIKEPLFIIDDNIRARSSGLPFHLEESDIEKIEIIEREKALELYKEEGRNGIHLVTTKGRFMAKENPFKIIESISLTGNAQSKEDQSSKDPLFVIDGVITNRKKQIEDLDPNDIEAIKVLKDKKATDQYGEAGKNGVVIITTRDYKKSAKEETFGNRILELGTTNIPKESIIVKAGNKLLKEKTDYTIDSKSGRLTIINDQFLDKGIPVKVSFRDTEYKTSDSIESISLTGDVSVRDEGVENINGNKIDYVNANSDREQSTITMTDKDGNKIIGKADKVNLTIQKDTLPLIVIDDVVKGKVGKVLEDIDPKDIKHINVVKGDAAIKKYGQQGADGVIEVYTKKGHVKVENSNATEYDTIVVFNADTYEETVSIVPSNQPDYYKTDTIRGDGLDTVIVFNANTFEETVTIAPSIDAVKKYYVDPKNNTMTIRTEYGPNKPDDVITLSIDEYYNSLPNEEKVKSALTWTVLSHRNKTKNQHRLHNQNNDIKLKAYQDNSGSLNISYESPYSEDVTYHIFDLLGRSIQKNSITSENAKSGFQIQLSNITTEVVIVVSEQGGRIKSEKVIVSN